MNEIKRNNSELSEESQRKMSDSVEQKAQEAKGFLRRIFSFRFVSSYLITRNLPFTAFVALLTLLYITNRHVAENTVRDIDRLSRQVKDLGWDYKAMNAELMKLTTQTEVAKRADTLGLEERIAPPIKIYKRTTDRAED